jgi:hypothetical protein
VCVCEREREREGDISNIYMFIYVAYLSLVAYMFHIAVSKDGCKMCT